MARLKSNQTHVRKLSRMGGRSIGLTLPIEFVRALAWRPQQKVVVRKQGARLIIRDWRP